VLWWGRGPTSFPTPELATNLWLLAAGPFTAIPLLLFAAGARRVSMTTLGLLQYIGPTIAFMLGIWVFHEPFTSARLVGFVFIWSALVVYSADGWRVARRAVAAA
jgi:chloramphenicol-sensitive protein RarD